MIKRLLLRERRPLLRDARPSFFAARIPIFSGYQPSYPGIQPHNHRSRRHSSLATPTTTSATPISLAYHYDLEIAKATPLQRTSVPERGHSTAALGTKKPACSRAPRPSPGHLAYQLPIQPVLPVLLTSLCHSASGQPTRTSLLSQSSAFLSGRTSVSSRFRIKTRHQIAAIAASKPSN